MMRSIRGLSVLKRYLLLCSLTTSLLFGGDVLESLLSKNKEQLFVYDFQRNEAQSDALEKSWINPIILRYGRNFTTQFGDKTIHTDSFTISIDQPIFRSGGIYYAIKYAKATRHARDAQIKQARRETIANAARLLFQLHIVKLQRQKAKIGLQNDDLQIAQKRELYEAGLLASSFLDEAILKRHNDALALEQLEMQLSDLESSFALLSDKDPWRLTLPKLKLIDAKSYKTHNLEIEQKHYALLAQQYNAKITRAKYLPTLSVQARYINEDINPLFAFATRGLNTHYSTYAVTLSMPLSITAFDEIEAAKLSALRAQTALEESYKAASEAYHKVQKRLKLIDRKIDLARKDIALYAKLLRHTKEMMRASEATESDKKILQNRMRMRKIDLRILALEKQLELLSLYAKASGAF